MGDETRTIFAGIKKSYTPEQLIGKLVVVIANLKPRKMKFGISNGMVLATQHNGDIIILQPEKDVAPGSKICLLYTSPSPRDTNPSRMPSSA